MADIWPKPDNSTFLDLKGVGMFSASSRKRKYCPWGSPETILFQTLHSGSFGSIATMSFNLDCKIGSSDGYPMNEPKKLKVCKSYVSL